MHQHRFGVTQTLACTATSAALANAFGTQTYRLRVCASTSCHIRIGEGTPVATAADPLLPPNSAEYLTVTPGQKVAAIRAASGRRHSRRERRRDRGGRRHALRDRADLNPSPKSSGGF